MLEAIIVAGGFGTRLRTIVPDVPKPMAPISGKPFLEILLNSLARKGFSRVVLSLGFKADIIVSHFDEQFAGLELAYVIENSPLGTGGATRLALANCISDHAFIFNGDTFLDIEVAEIERMWQMSRRPIIVSRLVPDTTRYGRLLVKNGLATGFTEKGEVGAGQINAGCYVLAKNSLDNWPISTPFSLESDYFSQIVSNEQVNVFETHGLFIDIGIPEDFNRAQTVLAPYI